MPPTKRKKKKKRQFSLVSATGWQELLQIYKPLSPASQSFKYNAHTHKRSLPFPSRPAEAT